MPLPQLPRKRSGFKVKAKYRRNLTVEVFSPKAISETHDTHGSPHVERAFPGILSLTIVVCESCTPHGSYLGASTNGVELSCSSLLAIFFIEKQSNAATKHSFYIAATIFCLYDANSNFYDGDPKQRFT